MTPEQRYQTIREQSEVFTNKAMLKHHLLTHLKEAIQEQREKDADIATLLGSPEIANAIRLAPLA